MCQRILSLAAVSLLVVASALAQFDLGTVVGTVKYAERGPEQLGAIAVVTVHYVDGDPGWRRGWLALRRWVARLLGEVV